MKCNVGKADKIFRFVIGAVIIATGFYFKSWWGLVGIVPIATALTSFCPLYLPFGIRTRKTEN